MARIAQTASTIAGTAAAAVVATLVVLFAIDWFVTGGEPLDPPWNNDAIRYENRLGIPITIRRCFNQTCTRGCASCMRFDVSDDLPVDGTAVVAISNSRSGPFTVRVERSARVLGCFSVWSRAGQQHKTVQILSVRRCDEPPRA